MATPDMDVIKEIPGYRVILKAILKSQIQQLVEQLASTTEEESVILTASVVDGTLCHLGSDSGKVFLEDHEDIKSQFLGFCLKRHHKKKQEKERQEAQEREEALARSMQAVTPPRYEGMSGGFMSHRSPRYPSPGQGLHPVALSRVSPGGRMRMPANRHQPYPMTRAPRPSVSFDQQQQGRTLVQVPGPGPVPSPMRLPLGNRLDGQIIKIEADEEEKSNQSAGDSANVPTPTGANSESSQPPSPSIKPAAPSQVPSDNDDAESESSTSTIPNDATDMKFNDSAPPGGLSLDSDLSNIIASTSMTDSDMQQPTTPQGLKSEPHTPVALDPNINVKLESQMDDSEMDLEITGVELGLRQPVQEPVSSQEWMSNVQSVMQGATGSPADMAGQQGYNTEVFQHMFTSRLQEKLQASGIETGDSADVVKSLKYMCTICGKLEPSGGKLEIHMRKHTGEQPYRCDFCPRAFSNKSNKTKHVKMHHSNI